MTMVISAMRAAARAMTMLTTLMVMTHDPLAATVVALRRMRIGSDDNDDDDRWG